MLGMFRCTNMEVVAGFNLVRILMERLLVTYLVGQFLSPLMVVCLPLGLVVMMEMVLNLDMSGCMNMEVVVGLSEGGTLMERLLLIGLVNQFFSPVMAMCWPLGL